MSRFRDTSATTQVGPNHGPVRKTQWFLLNEICTVILWHIGKFLDSDDFQYWQSQLQGRSVCKHILSYAHNVVGQRSGDSKLNVRSYDVAVNWRKTFPWFALRKIISNSGKLLFWSMTSFKKPELMMQLRAYQICPIFADTRMTLRISIQDGTKLYGQQVKYLRRMSLKLYTRWNYKGMLSFRQYWQWYDQEIVRDRAMPSNRHFNPMVRTRNFNAWDGIFVKSHKLETSALKVNWESPFSGKQLDSVQKETLVVSVTGKPQETDAITDTDPIPVKEHTHPLLLWERRARLTERSLRKKRQSKRSKSFWKERQKSVQNLPQRNLYGTVTWSVATIPCA